MHCSLFLKRPTAHNTFLVVLNSSGSIVVDALVGTDETPEAVVQLTKDLQAIRDGRKMTFGDENVTAKALAVESKTRM